MKLGFLALLLLLFLLQGCVDDPTPTLLSESSPTVALVSTAIPTPGGAGPTSSPTGTCVLPTQVPTETAAPLPSLTLSPKSLLPRATATPSTPPGSQPTPHYTPGPVPFLSLPLDVPLMPPPPGKLSSPLVGVTALVVHPDYPVVSSLAAGTNHNGILISQDGGASWVWSTVGLPEERYVRDLVIAQGEMAALVAIDSAWGVLGAFRSRDSGSSWDAIPGLSEGVESIVYSPAYATDRVIFAVQHGALLRSADQGESWTTVLSSNGCPLNVALSPSFAVDATALAPRCDHIARSTDGGTSWVDLPAQSGDLGVGNLMSLQVATDFPTSGILLAQGSVQGMPILSTDQGRNWQAAYSAGQAPFTLGTVSAVHYIPGATLYVVGRESSYSSAVTMWQSSDLGQNWNAVVQAAVMTKPVFSPDGEICVGTPDGIFCDPGGGWQLLHPGGNQLELVDQPSEEAAVARRGVSKYSSRIDLFEQIDAVWRLVFQQSTDKGAQRAFPVPNYADERMILLLGQDYGGAVWVMQLRPESAVPLTVLEAIPTSSGGYLDRYRVSYADGYAVSGRIELRHGYSGALYVSEDRGESWARPDPAEPGACERNPVSGFGALWFGDQELRDRLLCPLEDESPYSGTVQAFERGEILRLDPLVANTYRQVFALVPDWQGVASWGTLPHYEGGGTLDPPPGFFPPDPLFHTAWLGGDCCRPGALPVPESLGWALGEAAGLDIALQRFEGGILIWRGDRDEILSLEQGVDSDFYTVYPD